MGLLANHLRVETEWLTLFISNSVCEGQDLKMPDKAIQDTSVSYKDGIYKGKSRAIYIYEPYWGHVSFIIKSGLFTEINFVIRDSNLHETFNEKYEKHFEGNPAYILQCRNDWKGVQKYLKKLYESQSVEKVDAITGATWSYNLFKASVNDALKDAK